MKGVVALFSIGPDAVRARVRGSETYRVQLTGAGAKFTGDCTCPAYDRDGWYKHLVAVALAANAAGDTVGDRCAAIRAHLLTLPQAALVELVWSAAERDAVLLRRLDRAAGGAALPPAARAARLVEATRAAVDAAYAFDDDGAEDWPEELAELLAEVPSLLQAGAAAEAMALLEIILDDLPEAVAMLYDSGEGGALVERAAALHLEACRALRPDPVRLAAALFERECADRFDNFFDAAATYAAVLGDVGIAEYRRLAETAYAKLSPIPPPPASDPHAMMRPTLLGILDRFAAREGDLDRRIALRRAWLVDAPGHLRFAQFCLALGRDELALRTASDAAWQFEGRNPAELIGFVAERLVAAGRREDAIAALWRGFGEVPDIRLYRALVALGDRDAVADRALAIVAARRGTLLRGRFGGAGPVDFQILMHAERWPAAWACAQRHGMRDEALLALADASAATTPNEAAGVYRAALERRMGETGRAAYEAAIALLGKLAPLETAREHAAYVAALRARFRTKRLLLPMLDAHLATQSGAGERLLRAG